MTGILTCTDLGLLFHRSYSHIATPSAGRASSDNTEPRPATSSLAAATSMIRAALSPINASSATNSHDTVDGDVAPPPQSRDGLHIVTS
jgi:hypothetical protein